MVNYSNKTTQILITIVVVFLIGYYAYRCVDAENHALEYAVRDYNNGDPTIMETVCPNGRVAVTCIEECNQGFIGYLDELDIKK